MISQSAGIVDQVGQSNRVLVFGGLHSALGAYFLIAPWIPGIRDFSHPQWARQAPGEFDLSSPKLQ